MILIDDIDIDLANYADGTSPYAYDLENGKVIKLLEKTLVPDNSLNAKSDKCHMIINTDENVTLKIKNEVNTNNSNQKLLGILFNNNEHVTSLC